MKKAIKVVGIILGIIVIAIVGVGFWQKENLLALWQVTQYSQEEIGGSIEIAKAEVKEALDQYQITYIRDLTLEEEEQLRKGELSIEEAMSLIVSSGIGEYKTIEEDKSLEEEKQEVKGSKELQAKETNSEEAIVAKYTTQMYGLKAKYIGLLGGLESRGWQALENIPSEERTVKNLQKVGIPLVKEAIGLESQCNGEVEKVLGDLQAELEAVEGDTSIVETMRQAYYTEKRLKKAYYISLIPF